jgi:5,6,7,8-tetrahydromethanopterin hydro-lyase
VNTQFGEASAGEGAEVAHTSTVLGLRDGPVEAAWTTALATPSTGFPRLVVNLRPGMPVQPLTMMVPKLAVVDAEARVLRGPVQAGVAEAVVACVADGVIDHYDAHRLLLVVAVWLDPKAVDEEAIFTNQRAAARAALRAGASGGKPVHDVLDAAEGGAWNHFVRDRS